MNGYFEILLLILPVFLIILLGMGLRWRGIVKPEAEETLVGLVVKLLYPCLILRALLQANSFREQPNVLWAPFFGFVTIVIGFAVSGLLARLCGLRAGKGLRTFCFAAGIYNYGYLPIPIVEKMFGAEELAVLFMHNVGIEVTIWTVGIAMLAGSNLKDGLRRIANPMVYALLLGIGLNLLDLGRSVPSLAFSCLEMLSYCAVPLGLLAIGGNLYDHTQTKERLWDGRTSAVAVLARMMILPAIGLMIAKYAPAPLELKRILVIQAAMPSGILPIVIAKHYGGQAIVALRVVVATTVVGLVAMPFLIDVGLKWVLGG